MYGYFFLVSSKCFTIKECMGYSIILTGTYCCISSFGFAECLTLDALYTELCLEVKLIIIVGLLKEFKIIVRNY